MTKTLIVYHSRSGYTRRVARSLARRLHAELEDIRDLRPLEGPLGYAFCAFEALLGITPALQRSRHDVATYDVVVVGTPVWFWSLSSPVRSWLAQHRLGRKRVAFFCTMAGAGDERVFNMMTDVARVRPSATMSITDEDIDSGNEAKLDAFVRAIEAREPRRTAGPRRRTRAAHAGA